MNWTERYRLLGPWALWGCTLLLLLSTCARPEVPSGDDLPRSAHLMSCAQLLQAWEAGEAPLVIEVSKEAEYAQGHLPGAVHTWRPDYAADSGTAGMMADRAKLEDLLASLGADNDRRIVLYDERGNSNAARLWWILHQQGYTDVALLNGGKAEWKRSFLPMSEAHVQPEVGTFRLSGKVEKDLHAGKEEVLAAMQDPEWVILDARHPEEYSGKALKDGASQPGHIPGAINKDFVECVRYKSDEPRKFKSLSELESMFREIGVTKDKKILVYCHSGVRSALTTFVLVELLNYPVVKNYDGSWIEWSAEAQLPVAVAE